MNAQEIINQSEPNSTDYLEVFYPEIYTQRQADLNLSKCLRDLK